MDAKDGSQVRCFLPLNVVFRMLSAFCITACSLFFMQLASAQIIEESISKPGAVSEAGSVKSDATEASKRLLEPMAQPPSAPYIRDFSKPFNEYTWVAAHNAYLNDTTEELERGVRGLMWDVHPFRRGNYPDYTYEAYLCHKIFVSYDESPCAPASFTKRKFSEEIIKVMRFLDKEENKSAVVTLYLEDRADRQIIQDAFSSVPGLSDYVFDISEYSLTEHWPTLQQIIDSKRRIIFIFEYLSGPYLFGGTSISLPKGADYTVENNYDLGSAVSDDWDCSSRWPDIPLTKKYVDLDLFKSWRRLFTMNQFHAVFGSAAHAAQIDNNLTWLEYRVDSACAKDNDGERLVPNFIAIDYSQVGDAFPYAGALTEGGVYFYENNNGVSEAYPDSKNKNGPRSLFNSDVVCVLPTSVEWDIRLRSAGCENDETRSLALRGVKKDTSIKLFDKPNSSRSDDYTVINVLRDIGLGERVVVNSYEQSYKDSDVEVEHHHHNGLDGKVSHITIEPITGSVMPKIKFFDDRGNDVCSVPVDVATAFEMGGNGDAYGCSNDNAQSFQLTGGLAGSTITLFGTKDSNENCSQGCVRLFVRKDMTAVFSVANLDTFGAKIESDDKSVLAVRYGGTQQLAGKVSYIKVSMGGFTGEDVVPASAEADGSYGGWGAKARCPAGRFAWGFSLRIEKNQGDGDNTGLNSIKMFCSEDSLSNPIESDPGGWGDWSETYKCSAAAGPLKGFAIRTLWPRNTRDEVVATDIIGICGSGARVGGLMPENWGSWSSDFICPGDLNSVGFITRNEGYQGGGDDTAMNGMRMYCGRNIQVVLPAPPVVEQITPGTSAIYWEDARSQDGIAEFEIASGGHVLTSTHSNFGEFNTQGINSVSVTAVDFDGSRSLPITVAVPPYDATPPATPTGLTVANLNGGLFEVSWDAATASPEELAYEVSVDGQVAGLTTETSMAFNQSLSPANFTLAVRALKSNDTSSPAASIFIDRTPPPPPATLSFSDLQSNSLILSWAASVDDTKLKDYAVYREATLMMNTPETTVTSGYLDSNVSYTFSVKAIDEAGNYSDAISVFVDRETPAIPQSLEYRDMTDTSVRLSWTPSHDNVAVTGYSVTRDDGETFDTKTPALHDTTLIPLTTYNYGVSAYDANLNTSQPLTLLIDRTPPSMPVDPRYSDDTGTTLLLQWSPSTDNVGVAGYNVYPDDLPEAIGFTAITRFTATDLAPATTYTFHFEAIDAAGNKSARAPILVDRIPPVLAPFFYAYGAYGSQDTPPLLNWQDGTDDTGIVGYELSMDGTVIQAAISRPVKTADLDLSADEDHTFSLRAYDAANNYSLAKELVLYHDRPLMPKDIKGTNLPGGGIIYDWARGDSSTAGYWVQTDNGIDREQTEVQFTTSVNAELSPPSVTAKVESINSDGARSLSIFCKKINPASPAFPICELSNYTNANSLLEGMPSKP